MSDKNIKFIYYNKTFEIQNKEQTIIDSMNEFSNFLNQKSNDFKFFYKGKDITSNEKFHSQKITKNITILVFIFKKFTHKRYQENIICPECNNPCLLNYTNEILYSNNCLEKHNKIFLSFKDYLEKIKFKENELKCEFCGNPQDLYKKSFNFCSCNKIICPLCLIDHDLTHNTFDYIFKYFKCFKHNKLYEMFCMTCNNNICGDCEEEHKGHKKVFFKEIKSKINDIKKITNLADETKNLINEYKNELIRIKSIINNFIDFTVDNNISYFKIIDYVLNPSNSIDYMNYHSIKNILYIYDLNKVFKRTINDFINSSFKNKTKAILEQFDKKKSELLITYKNEPVDGKIKLFDKSFVNNNKNICYLILNDKKIELSGNIEVPPDSTKENIKIRLIREKTLKDISCMFYECKSLLRIENSDFFDNNEIVNIRCMFANCESLEYIPILSNINTLNIKDIRYLFYKCSSLKEVPDISNWSTINITDMTGLFCSCKSLKSLPDISYWNTKNVKNMSYIFRECVSLQFIPDISKWNISNVTDIGEMFYNCELLNYLPDISNWNVSNVTNMSHLFFSCKSLLSLPDISKWNIKNVVSLSHLFHDCKLLKTIPDISKWNTSKVGNMKYMFGFCESLTTLPDISNWNINKVINISNMFEGCINLKDISNISKWNISNVKKKSNIFDKCDSLISKPQFNINDIKDS